MKILYAASEIAPFFRTGGLAEVAGSLPAALASHGLDVRSVMPLHSGVAQEHRGRMAFLCSFTVQLSWRSQYCGVFELQHNGVTHYFLDNEYYFKRPFAYGEFDDGERFAFFSSAVLQMLPHIGFAPDVIHCNDWQTGLIPIYLNLQKQALAQAEMPRSVFTIHNIEYQGKYGMELLGDVFGIPAEAAGMLEYGGELNLMKGAIAAAQRITTVSPTYAGEILMPEHGHALDGILRENSAKLAGILNGIDCESYNPETDSSLFQNYSAADPASKAQNKAHLQRMLGLAEDTGVPVIGLIARLAGHKGMDLIGGAVEELLSGNVQLVVLGTGDWQYEHMFADLQRRYPGKVSASILFSNDLSRKIYAASDLFLMPSLSEPCGLSQMIALRYGALPVVRETGGLADTIRNISDDGATGNGFSFAAYNSRDMLHTIHRALGFYGDRTLWAALVRRAMACDFGWAESARDYIKTYRAAVGIAEQPAGTKECP